MDGSRGEDAVGQGQLPHNEINLFEEGFVFPVSVLFTADAHQETMEMFWLYGWEALILSIFIYGLEQNAPIKTKHPYFFWKKLRHLAPDTLSCSLHAYRRFIRAFL